MVITRKYGKTMIVNDESRSDRKSTGLRTSEILKTIPKLGKREAIGRFFKAFGLDSNSMGINSGLMFRFRWANHTRPSGRSLEADPLFLSFLLSHCKLMLLKSRL